MCMASSLTFTHTYGYRGVWEAQFSLPTFFSLSYSTFLIDCGTGTGTLAESPHEHACAAEVK